MLEYKTGNILGEETDALVNAVNCKGVMGRGIALQFKNAFPDNFKAYAEACKRQEVQPGRMFVFDTGRLTQPRYIVNFPTKRHWRGKSRMEDIQGNRLNFRGDRQGLIGILCQSMPVAFWEGQRDDRRCRSPD